MTIGFDQPILRCNSDPPSPLPTSFAGDRYQIKKFLGEPGIEKTALTEQLATYVSLRGGKSIVGHCYEEGSLSLPYLAFVEALRTYVTDRDVTELRKELGTGAGDVARICSKVRERLKIEG